MPSEGPSAQRSAAASVTTWGVRFIPIGLRHAVAFNTLIMMGSPIHDVMKHAPLMGSRPFVEPMFPQAI